MILSSQLILEESEIKNVDDLVAALTFPNPEYVRAVKSKNKWKLAQTPKERSYIYYNEDTNQYMVPRNFPKRYFYRRSKRTDETSLRSMRSKAVFNFALRDYQQDFFDEFDPLQSDNCVYEVSCGLGKTIMALYSIVQRQQRTVIIAPTNKLLGQWYREACEAISGVKIGIADKNVELTHTKYDILLLSQDLARSRELDEEFFSTFGFAVWDEGHLSGAESYLPVIENCVCKYRLLLTATFRRKDGNDKLLTYHFGECFTMRYSGPPALVYGFKLKNFHYQCAIKYELTSKVREELIRLGTKVFTGGTFIGLSKPNVAKVSSDQKLANKVSQFNKTTNFSALASLSTSMPRRNNQVYRMIKQLLDSGRNVLVLSKRKDILYEYYELFKDEFKTYLVVSETNKDHTEKEMNKDARLILGIQQLAEFGFNVPRLDTLLLLHPITDTEQAIGRILRQYEGKKQPVAICAVDNNTYLEKLFHKAVREYVPYNGVYQGTYNFHKLCQKLISA